MRLQIVAVLVLALIVTACEHRPATGRASITAAGLAQKIKTLSSNEFEGRAPSTEGEAKAVYYIRGEFQKYGIQPGNGDSYYEEVPLVDITANDMSPLTIDGNEGQRQFVISKDMVATTRRVVGRIDLRDSPIVFVGYGIVAPEYNWNDYAGIDMRGKTALILVNDPGYATKDPKLFKGNEMTYYGRWTYKYEEAMRQGADAAFVIHSTGPAGYPWEVVRNGWTGRKFYAERKDGNMARARVEGWVTLDAAKSIFEQAGLDYDALASAAAKAGFTPVPMELTASVSFDNTIGHSRSKNVVGIVRGSETPDEYFIYTAHWDHFGIGQAVDGDNIYNGAVDNGSGSAGLLELAQAFASLKTKPKRSVIFLATTAEEQGLLGSQYYADHPIYPLNKTVGGLNMDVLNTMGPTHDITVVGYGLSGLDAYIEKAAEAKGRVIAPDPDPSKGHYFRSDHFSLAKKGVPMLDPKSGIDSIAHGAEWGRQQMDDYTAHTYHKPSDEYHADWDLTGMAEDVRLYYDVGYAVANSSDWPNWKPGSQFLAVRDKSLESNRTGEPTQTRSGADPGS